MLLEKHHTKNIFDSWAKGLGYPPVQWPWSHGKCISKIYEWEKHWKRCTGKHSNLQWWTQSNFQIESPFTICQQADWRIWWSKSASSSPRGLTEQKGCYCSPSSFHSNLVGTHTNHSIRQIIAHEYIVLIIYLAFIEIPQRVFHVLRNSVHRADRIRYTGRKAVLCNKAGTIVEVGSDAGTWREGTGNTRSP